MTLENQRYGRNKATLVNKKYIESGDYRAKFDRITENPEINRILYAKAKEILLHRSGTLFEDMYWLDAQTGEVTASVLNEQSEQQITYTENLLRKIAGKDLITIHNHPGSMPPSIDDFNSAFSHGYTLGVVICHDGSVFVCSAWQEVSIRLHDFYTDDFINLGYPEKEAQFKALKIIEANHDIEIKEV